MSDEIAGRLSVVRSRLEAACCRAGRSPGSVRLVAVSKGHGTAAIREALLAGQRCFGENYAQEMLGKQAALADASGLEFHFIGHLQSNKAKQVVGRAALIQSVDRESLVEELAKRVEERGLVQEILFEVHLSPEPSKRGCAPESLPALLASALHRPALRPRGLMTMPPFFDDPEQARPFFARLRTLQEDLAGRFSLPDFRHLSMGMSHDFEIAIEDGATLVRVGTAIFGERLQAASGLDGGSQSEPRP